MYSIECAILRYGCPMVPENMQKALNKPLLKTHEAYRQRSS